MGCGASKEAKKATADNKPGDAAPDPTKVPSDFPTGVEAERVLYENWAQSTFALNVLTCHPKNEEQVLQVVNWAAAKGWKVRAVGIRHNWSPITIENKGLNQSLDGVVLVSLMRYMTAVTVDATAPDKPARARVQLGCKQLDFLTKLEQANDQGGFALMHTPAPDSITIGGMIAIDGHGTAVPCEDEYQHVDRATASYGSYSNLVLAVRAVVWDDAAGAYTVKEFRREDGDAIAPFLAHVGRALLTEATLHVQPNYRMRCQSILNIPWEEMFPATPADPTQPQERSMAWYLRKHGRAEAIWFPFTESPWLKVWSVTGPEMPEGSTRVDKALNYPFSDDLGPHITKYFRSLVGSDTDATDDLLKKIHREQEERLGDKDAAKEKRSFGSDVVQWLDDVKTEFVDEAAEVIGGPKKTPFINKMLYLRVCAGMITDDADDLWGWSKNTLVYVRDDTLRVTANGYAVMTNMDNVQECMYVFATMYFGLLEKYAKQGKFPISCPLEIRVTGIDDPAPLGIPNATSPPLSALHQDSEATREGDGKKKWDVALWLDVLSLPGAAHSNEFYAEMETLMMQHDTYNGKNGRIRPEWSKGWGYSAEGPWKSTTFINHTRKMLPGWNDTMAQLRKHDPKNLYTNPWMDEFFVDVDENGAPKK